MTNKLTIGNQTGMSTHQNVPQKCDFFLKNPVFFLKKFNKTLRWFQSHIQNPVKHLIWLSSMYDKVWNKHLGLALK